VVNIHLSDANKERDDNKLPNFKFKKKKREGKYVIGSDRLYLYDQTQSKSQIIIISMIG